MKKVNVSEFYERMTAPKEKQQQQQQQEQSIKRKRNGCVECGALRHSKYSNCSKKKQRKK